MATWQSIPQLTVSILHGYVWVVDAASVVVRRRENGFDIATITVVDTQSEVYADQSACGDTVIVKEKDSSDEDWNFIFTGVIRERHPALSTDGGSLLRLECDGQGYGLGATVCGEEYGTDSRNLGDNSLKEIVEDIIGNWAEKVLGTAVDSGYIYPQYIEDIAGVIRYISFPYKWNYKAINDLCDYMQAIKGTDPGPHWIVDTVGRFLLTTVGVHVAPAVTYWPTYWRTDAAGSTLTEGVDFERFEFEELSKEANYILYGGIWRRPGGGDACENTSGHWGSSEESGGLNPDPTINDSDGEGAGKSIVGRYSIFTWIAGGGIGRIFWPAAEDMHLDLSNVGTIGNPPYLNFYCLKNNTINALDAWVVTGTGTVISRALEADLVDANKWYHFRLPLGPYYNTMEQQVDPPWALWVGTVDWSDVNSVGLYFGISDSNYLFVDGFHMTGGPVLRGARTAAAYDSTNPLKVKVITDNVAKDDSLQADDDSGMMARLAKAELLRCQSTPIIGTFRTPIAPDALPGQLIYIKARKKSDESYAIDKLFRVTQLIHTVSSPKGAFTTWNVTDDIKNAVARTAISNINTVMSHTRPEWQDRQASSIKGDILDIDVPILEKSY